MDPYLAFWHTLAWTLAIAGCPLITAWWGKFAYKIWNGAKEIDEEFQEEMWVRCGWCSAAMFVAALVFLGLDYFIIDQLEVPGAAAFVHIVVLIAFLSLASFAMMHFYALEDFFSGLIMVLLYIYIPALVLLVIYWAFRWNPLIDFVYSWLPRPKVGT